MIAAGIAIAALWVSRFEYHDTTCEASSGADARDEAASYAQAGEAGNAAKARYAFETGEAGDAPGSSRITAGESRLRPGSSGASGSTAFRP